MYQVQAVGEELSGDENERSGRIGDVCVLQSAVEDGKLATLRTIVNDFENYPLLLL